MAKEKINIPRGKTHSELYQEVARRLNKQGLLPFRGREYNIGIVMSHVYGRIKDEQVKQVLTQVANEWLSTDR